MDNKIFDMKFDAWNKKLLDLTRRNRLLNHRVKKVGTYVFEEDISEVYQQLVFDGGFKFDINFNILDEEEELKVKDRTKRLENIRQSIRTCEIERGFNIGYIAFGFLNWSDNSNAVSNDFSSPLILVPVEIQRTNLKSPIKIKFKDDEGIHINPVLIKKLENDFGIDIDENYEVEDIALALEYLKDKTNINGWKVENKVLLDTFDFQNLVIQKDLQKNIELVRNNIFIQALCTGNDSSQGELFSTYNDKVDIKHENPKERLQILDADSSQQEAISRARRGDSFVLQGPPGTGKSQTITNIIAEALGQGKRVLFVSEKQAALDVVHSKLNDNGLGDFLLTLHNVKQNKKDVRNQLGRSLSYSGKEVKIDEEFSSVYNRVLSKTKELDNYSEVLHRKQGDFNLSFYQIHGKLAELSDAPDLFFEIDHKLFRGSFEEVQELFRHVDQLSNSYITTTHHHKNNGWKYLHGDLSLAKRTELNELFKRYKSNYSLLIKTRKITQENFPNFITDENILEFANRFNSIMKKRPETIQPEDFKTDLDKVLQLIEERSTCLKTNTDLESESLDILNHITNKYDQGVDDFKDVGLDLKLLKFEYGSLFKRMFSSDYKNLLKDYRFKTKELKLNYNELVQDLELIEKYELNNVEIITNVNIADENERLVQKLCECTIDFDDSEQTKGLIWMNTLKSLVLDSNMNYLLDYEYIMELLNTTKKDIEEVILVAQDQFTTWENIQSDIYDIKSEFKGISEFSDEEVEKFVFDFDFDSHSEYFANIKNREFLINEYGLSDFIDKIEQSSYEYLKVTDIFKKRFFLLYLSQNKEYVELETTTINELNQRVSTFQEDDRKSIELSKERILRTLTERIPNVNEDIKTTGGEIQVLKKELKKKSRMLPTRKLIEELPTILPRLKPCIMMSPLTVSTYFSSNPDWEFDLVIFDEASQVRPEFAIAAISRAKQIVVAGDSKQMPPSSFFGATSNDEELIDDVEDVEDLESILDELSVAIPETYLNWHYRSKDESLITFSNRKFYNDRLYTFPSHINGAGKGVKFTYLPDGVWESVHGNIIEAKRVAKVIHHHALNNKDKSLGVVAFGKKQAKVIEEEVIKLRQIHPEIEEFFDENKEEHFFIKNLENVQGDERDVIILSVGYGPNPKGNINMNFGPLINTGGERRLNVAVTRAQEEMHVISSMRGSDIRVDDTANQNRVVFRDFLSYAEFGVKALPGYDVRKENNLDFDSVFEESVFEFLVNEGFEVHSQVGESGYRIDLAVVHPQNKGRYAIAIECDGAAYHSSRTARDRDRLRQDILEYKGWKFYRIWSTTWIHDNKNEKDRLLKAIKEAIDEEIKISKEEPEVITPLEPQKEIILEDKMETLPKYYQSDVYMFKNNIKELSIIMLRASEDLVGYNEEDFFKYVNKKVFDKNVMSKGYRDIYNKGLDVLLSASKIRFKNGVIA